MGKITAAGIIQIAHCSTTASIKGCFLAIMLCVVFVLFGCTNKELQPSKTSLSDLASNAKTILEKLPNVVMVTNHCHRTNPTHRIVHILDWHYVSKTDFGADLRSQSAEPISDEEIDRLHAEHLDEVERIQQQQMELLRVLIQSHGLKRIHKEGLAEKDVLIFEAKVAAFREFGNKLLALNGSIGSDDKSPALITQIEELESQHRRDILQLGAAGRLLLSNEIESVLPLEESEAFAAANPVGEDGKVSIDQGKNEAREDAQLRILLNGDPLSVVVLGGAHDLSDNMRRMPDAKAEYIRVEYQAWKQITEGN